MKRGLIHSILLRYMISYAVIMAVLFAGVSVYMNNSYANSIRRSTVENSINRLSTLRLQHEEKLTTLVTIGVQIGLSYYISPFRLEDEPLKAYHLKQQLLPYAVTSDFCDHLFLIFNEDSYLYSSATTVGIDMFVDTLMRYEHVPPETLRALLRRQDNMISILPSQAITSILTDGTENNMVTVLVPLLMGERYNTGNVMFLINDRRYQQLFSDEIHEPRGMYIFHESEVLAASRDLAIEDDEVLAALRDYEGTLVKDISLAGVDYLLVALRGNLYGMQYVTVIPAATMKAHMASSQLGFVLFLCALSIPCIVLTYFFARRHARPIRELSRLFGGTAPKKDDFEVIGHGIASLVDSNERLKNRLQESLPMRRAAFIAAFVKGQFAKRADAAEAAAALGLSIDRRLYQVALISTSRDEDDALDVDALMALGSVDGYGAELVALEQHLFAVFADEQEALDRWAFSVKSLRLPSGGALTVAVSNAQDDFARAGGAFLEASTAYDNRFVMGSAQVLRFGDVSAAAKDTIPFTRSYLEGFRKALRARDARALSDRIDELFHYLTNTELSLFAFRMIYNNVIGALLGEQLEQSGGTIDALRYYDVFTLSGCRSIDDLDDILRKLCQDILSSESATPAEPRPMIRDIIAYMGEHFTEPALSMSAIADAYGISAVRLSLDFKEATGINPSEYLLLLRMEKAKELLSGAALSVKDIGLAVGYYDASGFIRRFKRYMAMTPAQYRLSQKKDGAGDEGTHPKGQSR